MINTLMSGTLEQNEVVINCSSQEKEQKILNAKYAGLDVVLK